MTASVQRTLIAMVLLGGFSGGSSVFCREDPALWGLDQHADDELEFVIDHVFTREFDQIHAFLSDKDGVWAATTAGIWWCPQSDDIPEYYQVKLDSVSAYSAYVVYRDRPMSTNDPWQGDLWMGTNQGPARLTFTMRRLLDYGVRSTTFSRQGLQERATVTSIGREPDQNIYWFGTSRGLYRWPVTGVGSWWSSENIGSEPIKLIYEERRPAGGGQPSPRTFWVGTQRGLWKWNSEDGDFDPEDPSDPLLIFLAHRSDVRFQWNGPFLDRFEIDSVQAVYQDLKQAYWVATNAGLYRWYNGRIQSIKIDLAPGEGAQQFSERNVVALTQDGGGGLWMGTTSGEKHRLWFARAKKVQLMPAEPARSGFNAWSLLAEYWRKLESALLRPSAGLSER